MQAVESDDRGLIVSCPTCGQRNRLAYEKLGQAARCPQCRSELRAPGEPVELETDTQFDALTARSKIKTELGDAAGAAAAVALARKIDPKAGR